MVNEERLRHMVRLAQFDQNDGEACRPMTQYARKDYVALQMLKSFVTGSMSYALLFGLWALHSVEELLNALTGMEIQALIISLVLSYAVFMVLYLGATYIVFSMKYTKGRRKVKKYYASLKKVNQMYEREERLKTTAGGDWE